MFQNIIFDWSGVVNDNAYAVYQTVIAIFDSLNTKRISFDEFKRNWRQPVIDFYHLYIPNMVLEDTKEIFKQNILKYDQNKPYSGFVDLIKKLKINNKKLFVITSDLPQTINNQLKIFNLENMFDEIVVESHDKAKDSESLIKKYSLDLQKTIIVGDSNHEIESGKKVGIKTVAVTWGFCLEEKLKTYNPDFMVHNLDELEKIILT